MWQLYRSKTWCLPPLYGGSPECIFNGAVRQQNQPQSYCSLLFIDLCSMAFFLFGWLVDRRRGGGGTMLCCAVHTLDVSKNLVDGSDFLPRSAVSSDT